MMTWAQLSLQDALSPVMEEFLFFHDFALVILLGILGQVSVLLSSCLVNPTIDKGLLSSHLLETIWTLAPGLVLAQVAIPSLLLLYTLDESKSCSITVKATGHQWYWSYELSDFWKQDTPLEFDSYMAPSHNNLLRLLDVDTRLVLPMNTHIRCLISSADVLHAWTVPSLGVKADACPGRLNQVKFISNRPGLFFGQCSEICGANHSFMPIALELVSGAAFLNWMYSFNE